MTEMETQHPWLYVAGPYTHDDPVLNTHRAVKVCSAIIEHTDYFPICPHLTLLWHLVDPRPIEWWYAYDLAMMQRCDAITRLPGLSTGADNEVAFAVERGLEVVAFDWLPLPVKAAWFG